MLSLARHNTFKFPVVFRIVNDTCEKKYSTRSNLNNGNISKGLKNDLMNIRPKRLDGEIDSSFVSSFNSKQIYNLAVELSQGTHYREMALSLLFNAAIKGNPEALNDIGSLISNEAPELNLEKKLGPKIGVKLLKAAVKCGNADAAMNLGYHHLLGKAVEHSVPKALKYYKVAKELGHNEAMGNINFINQFIITASDPQKTANFYIENPFDVNPLENQFNALNMNSSINNTKE